MRHTESRFERVGREYALLVVRTAGAMAGIGAFGVGFTTWGAPDFALARDWQMLGVAAFLALAALGCFYSPAGVLNMPAETPLGPAARGRDVTVDDESRR